MPNARMIARAWMDDAYRSQLLAQGLEVPPRPEDLADEQLDLLAIQDRDGDGAVPAPQTCCC